MVSHTTLVAEKLLHEKLVLGNGDIIETRIIIVPPSSAHPEGIRYALVYIHQGKRVVGYDNFEQKGHHKHLEKLELPYQFENVEKLIQDFREDIKQWRFKKWR